MDGPPAQTQQLEELMQTVEDLRRRVLALEQHSEAIPRNGVPLAAVAVPSPDPSVATLSSGLLAALGRLLLGIAGAYLLRAITEQALLPQLAGTLVGLLYACAWLVSSIRFAAPNRLIIALQGVTAALIVAPLLWEATVRFHSLSPASAAAALALFVVLGLLIAWRRDFSVLAGVTALAGSATAIALIIATLDPVPFVIAIAVAAAVVEYGACRDRALSVRWIIALAVDFCAFLLMYLVTRPQGLPEGYAAVPVPAVIAIQVALVAIYLASTVTRTLIRRRPIGWFEITQLVAIVSLAIGGGLRVAHGAGAGLIAIGVACLTSGAFCYLAAFTNLTRRPAIGRNFHAYATFAMLLTLTGSVLLFPGVTITALWCLLALVSTLLGERRNGNTLRMQGALYLAAAATVSGLLAYTFETMTSVASRGWRPITAGTLLCAVSAALGYAIVLWSRKDRDWTGRVSAAILAALLCWTTMGLAAGWLISARVDASLASTLRTALACAVAITLAWFGGRANLRELLWILYPWMTFGAVKLIAEDFRQGRSSTLFLSLLLYGGTLIVLPRLLRRARTV